jgi:signal transduction histidine kinase
VASERHALIAVKRTSGRRRARRRPAPLVAGARIKQTLYNLVSNGEILARRRTVSIRVRALAAADSPPEAPSVELEVEDRGIGIRREDQQLIRRVPESTAPRATGGTGSAWRWSSAFVEMPAAR